MLASQWLKNLPKAAFPRYLTRWSRKHVVVTGGLGFIGSHIVEDLMERGANVDVVDNSHVRPCLFSKKLSDYKAVCARLGAEPRFNDIDLQFEPKKFRKALKDADVVFHLAAYFGGRGFVDNQQTECTAMFAVDQNVFRMVLEEGAGHLYYSSSACVYPNELQTNRKYLLKEEDAGPYHGWESADNIYGWAKLMGERQLKILHEERGLSCSTCRFLTVYGPREYDDSHAIAALINRTLRREDPFVVWGDGTQERGFTYVKDIATGSIRAAEVVKDGTPLNLGVDWRVNMKKVVSIIHSYLNFKPKKMTYDESKPVGPLSRALDITKTSAMLGWRPKVTIEEGLDATTKWHSANARLVMPERFHRRNIQ